MPLRQLKFFPTVVETGRFIKIDSGLEFQMVVAGFAQRYPNGSDALVVADQGIFSANVNGFAETPSMIRELEPDATMLDGLTIGHQKSNCRLGEWVGH